MKAVSNEERPGVPLPPTEAGNRDRVMLRASPKTVIQHRHGMIFATAPHPVSKPGVKCVDACLDLVRDMRVFPFAKRGCS